MTQLSPEEVEKHKVAEEDTMNMDGDDSDSPQKTTNPAPFNAKVTKAGTKVSGPKFPKNQTSNKDTPLFLVPTVITRDFIAEEIWSREEGDLPSYAVRFFTKNAKLGVNAGDIVTEIRKHPIKEILTKNKYGFPLRYRPVNDGLLSERKVMVPDGTLATTFDEVLDEGFKLACTEYDCREEDREMYKFMVHVAQSSWYLDKFIYDFTNGQLTKTDNIGTSAFAPIIALRGLSGSGKNRAMTGLLYNSYRPFLEAHTSHVASIYRPMNNWRGTLCVDEADIPGDEFSELVKYYNMRAQGTAYIRVNPSDLSEHDVFANFGLTILTQRRGWEDNATEGRTLPMDTKKSSKHIPTVSPPENIEQARILQDKLLWLRLTHWPDIHIDRTFWIPELSDHRLMASLLPMHAISPMAPQIFQNITEMALRLDLRRREIKSLSSDGLIVNAIWDYLKKGYAGYYQGIWYVGRDTDSSGLVIPLTMNQLSEDLGGGFSAKMLRNMKSLGLLNRNKLPKDPPEMIWVGTKKYRVIWFDPDSFNTVLSDLVVDYKDGEVHGVLPHVTNKQATIQQTEVTEGKQS